MSLEFFCTDRRQNEGVCHIDFTKTVYKLLNNVLIMFGDTFFYSMLPIIQVEVNKILTNTHKAVVFVWRLGFRHFPCDTTPKFSKILSIKWYNTDQNIVKYASWG